MTEFKRTDFVQVRHYVLTLDNVEAEIWRNALYLGAPNGNHSVLYTDGTQEVVVKGNLRKAILVSG